MEARSVAGVFTLDMLSEKDPYIGPDGSRYAGVSTISKVLDKPNLVHAAWKVGTTGRTLDEAWYNAPAQRGKVAHGRIEAYCRDLVFSEEGCPAQALEDSDEAVERFKAFWAEHDFELLDAERMMVVPALRAGGRLDLYARRRRSFGPYRAGAKCLLDVKTAKGFFAEQKIQLCGYGELASRPHLINPTRGKGPMFWTPAEPLEIDELWIARVGNEQPGDMDAMQLSASEVDLHTRVFLGLAAMYYDIKKVLARR